jgi:predicted RNA-binding protein YlqC (UPF0109 family)
MSDPNRPDAAAHWGRPLRRKNKYAMTPPAASGTAGAPAVGPVDDPSRLAEAGSIIHVAPRPLAGTVIGASPAPRAHHEPRDPDEKDEAFRDLVIFMAKGIVDEPEDVKVRILEAGEDTALELEVHPDDIGHVIGKQGRTVRSLRMALGAAAARAGRGATLELVD